VLGEGALEKKGAQEFVFTALAKAEFGGEQEYAISVAFAWVGAARKAFGQEGAFQLVCKLFEKCGTDETRVRLLVSLYQPPASVKNLGGFSAPEIEWLRSEEIRDLFVREGKIPSFLETIGWTIHHDLEQLRVTVEQVLAGADDDTRTRSAAALFDSVYWAIRTGSSGTYPDDIAEWLLAQITEVFDLGDLGEMTYWHLEEVLKKVGKPSLVWLGNVVKMRMADERHRHNGYYKVLCDHRKLTRFLHPVEEAEAQKTEFISTIDYFLDLLLEHPGVAFYLPDYLVVLDPNGFIVPDLVVRRIGDELGIDEVSFLATVGGRYKIGTKHWRTIAAAVIEVAPVTFNPIRPLG